LRVLLIFKGAQETAALSYYPFVSRQKGKKKNKVNGKKLQQVKIELKETKPSVNPTKRELKKKITIQPQIFKKKKRFKKKEKRIIIKRKTLSHFTKSQNHPSKKTLLN